ncbi:MAG TPA: hypothetical protein VML55_18245 [Planctomycetaceae bacterium]|nr:hypothetical protein [Planctomycetaceae bacterium]
MSGTTRVAPVLVWCLAAAAGCSHVAEKRAISRFSQALDEQHLANLATHSSQDFSRRALRREESLDGLKMLRLPTGELEIVSVEDVSDRERLVTADLGKSKRRAWYRLVREQGSRKWVIDDVLLRQTSEGVRSDRSVSEQMDLMLAVHEFLDAWNGSRDEALQVTTPEFRTVLADLPPVHFARLTKRVVGDQPSNVRLTSPGVTNQTTGIVRVPRKTGTVVLTLRQLDGGWKVADIAVESREDREHLPSVFKTAVALNAASDFLEAYRAGDKPRLAGLCTDSFYRRGLLPGELESVPLPPGDVVEGDSRIDMQPTSAEFLIPTGPASVVKLSLKRTDGGGDSESPPEFRVDEVTLYEPGDEGGPPREMRLSVLFTGRAMLRLFSEALARGDLAMLRKTSTPDFNRRVWQQLDPEMLRDLGPMTTFTGGLRVVHTKFQGAVTEVTVDQAGRRMTYVLRDRAGDVRVDDVLVSAPGLPGSIKETVELLLPVRNMAAGLSLSRLDVLQQSSSRDLNRNVWTQTDQIPPVGYAAIRHLQAPLTAVEQTGEDEVLLVLGDEQFGARVLLVREQARYAVDDVMLIAGPDASRQARFKRRLREELAHGLARMRRTAPPDAQAAYAGANPGSPSYSDPPAFETARHAGAVVQAGFQAPRPLAEARAAAPPEPSYSAFDAPDDFPADPAIDRTAGRYAPHHAAPADSGERVHIVPGAYGAGAVPRRGMRWE